MSLRKPRMVSDPSEFTVKLKETTPAELESLKDELNSIVVGQERAVRKILRTVSMFESGMHDKNRVLPVVFFAGPSGVGKTYLARTIAEKWIGVPEEGQTSPLVVLSGENYSDKYAGNQLLGSPHGYIGYGDKTPLEDIGAFEREKSEKEILEELQAWYDEIHEEYGENITEEIEMSIHQIILGVYNHYIEQCGPFRSVLLIDEFEKMHPDVQKQFLTMFSQGSLELRSGKTIDLRSTLIILTSNIGTSDISEIIEGSSIGFQASQPNEDEEKDKDQKIYKAVREKIRKALPAELYSRIGHEGIVVFHPLTEEDYIKIIGLEIGKVQKEVSGEDEDQGVVLINATKEFYDFILENADANREGARQIERLIDKYMREPLAQQIASDSLRDGDEILFTVKKDKVQIYRKPRPRSPKLPPFTKKNEDTDMDAIRDDIADDLDDLWKQLTEELYKQHYGKALPKDSDDDTSDDEE